MFSDELKNISWEETTERIARMTDNDVRRALAKDHCDVNDFIRWHVLSSSSLVLRWVLLSEKVVWDCLL